MCLACINETDKELHCRYIIWSRNYNSMGRNSNNTFCLSEISFLWQGLCYMEEDCCPSLWNPTKLFGKDSSYYGFPFNFVLSCHMNHFKERFCLPHSQPQDKLYAASRHMEALSSVYMLFHFCCMLLMHKAEILHKRYANTTRNGTHVSIRAWFYVRLYANATKRIVCVVISTNRMVESGKRMDIHLYGIST